MSNVRGYWGVVWLVSLLFVAGGKLVTGEESALRVVDLKCEYLVNPQGIDEESPRFSWRLESSRAEGQNEWQSAWRLLVSDSKDSLARGEGTCWDTGWRETRETSQVAYKGVPLVSDHEYFWTVLAKDQDGKGLPTAEPVSFTTGILDPSEWSAKWIGVIKAGNEKHPLRWQSNDGNDPWLRKSFELPEQPVQARFFVASVGYHEVYVNGQKLDAGILVPNVSDHRHRARYVTYDLLPYLKAGKNVIAIWLGTGWAPFPEYAREDKPNTPMVLAQSDIHFAEREPIRIITDGSWKSHKSPSNFMGTCVWNDMGGEHYDARDEMPDWNSVDLDDSDWLPVRTFDTPLILSSQMTPENGAFEEITPVAIVETSPGVWQVDMGRHYAGWFEAKVKGDCGDYVHFAFSEHVEMPMTFNNQCAYTIGPSGEGTFHSRFNYVSGRWVTITGAKQQPDLSDIKGWNIRTAYAEASSFECSDELQNWMYETCLWTFRNLSVGGYVVDCPQRERLGYGGDAHATCETGMYNYDMPAFYTKWMEDWRDVQQESGALPNTAPNYSGGGGPAWGGIVITLPWLFYQQYGDDRILERNFDLMTRWLAFLESNVQEDLLVRYGGEWDFLGDWLWPGAPGETCNDTDETLCFNNCYRVFNLMTAAKIARVLDKGEQAAVWEEQAERARAAINKKWFHAEDTSWGNGWMTLLATGLLADVAPPELRDGIWLRLEREILDVHKGHVGSGITGGAMLFKLLRENNRNDLIAAMTSQTEYPGWGFMKANGATTFWEAWELNRPGHSLLHSSYLFPGAWYIDSVLGIRSANDGHGFQHIVIVPPRPESTQLTWAKGHYDSEYGRIEVSWKKEGEQLALTVTLPPNTQGKVILPAKEGQIEREIGSGTWVFP